MRFYTLIPVDLDDIGDFYFSVYFHGSTLKSSAKRLQGYRPGYYFGKYLLFSDLCKPP